MEIQKTPHCVSPPGGSRLSNDGERAPLRAANERDVYRKFSSGVEKTGVL